MRLYGPRTNTTKRKKKMANAELMVPFIRKWEGGWADDPDDAGGCTMAGVTIATYQKYYGKDKTCDDLRFITQEEWLHIFKCGYWDKMKADQIDAKPHKEVFDKIWNMRYEWLCNIAKKGNNKKFLKGWLNRLNDIKFEG